MDRMMNAIATTIPDLNFPAPLPRQSSDRLAVWEMAIDGGEITADRAPSPAQLQSLAARTSALRSALAPAPDAERRAELAALFLVLAFEKLEGEEAVAMQRIYLSDLGDIPFAALREACGHFRRTAKWVPSIADIRGEAAHYAAPWAKELRRIESVVNAKVIGEITPEIERKRSAAVERWENEIRPQIAATIERDRAIMRGKGFRAGTMVEPPKPETPDEALARLQALPMPKLSPAALSTIRARETAE
jgi:hypothetical protein